MQTYNLHHRLEPLQDNVGLNLECRIDDILKILGNYKADMEEIKSFELILVSSYFKNVDPIVLFKSYRYFCLKFRKKNNLTKITNEEARDKLDYLLIDILLTENELQFLHKHRGYLDKYYFSKNNREALIQRLTDKVTTEESLALKYIQNPILKKELLEKYLSRQNIYNERSKKYLILVLSRRIDLMETKKSLNEDISVEEVESFISDYREFVNKIKDETYRGSEMFKNAIVLSEKAEDFIKPIHPKYSRKIRRIRRRVYKRADKNTPKGYEGSNKKGMQSKRI